MLHFCQVITVKLTRFHTDLPKPVHDFASLIYLGKLQIFELTDIPVGFHVDTF